MTSSDGSPTLLYYLYRSATALIAPFAYRKVAAKLAAQGVSAQRQRERLGHATLPRPDGQVIWFHGASVGESLAALTLINRLGDHLPQARFLLTTGTATAQQVVAKRMPPRCCHQFAPLDAAGPVRRFLSHWRPSAGIFVESELWPVTLVSTRRSGAKLALVNARLSDRSMARWRKKAPTARFVMQQFSLFLTQNQHISDGLLELGAPADRVRGGGNLKAGADPLPIDDDALAQLRDALGSRPTWVASSTHIGEEQVVLTAHKALLKQHPELCLMLVPRHPDRGAHVADLVAKAGMICARRSKGELPTAKTQIYLADTMGELGTWYALSPIVFLGGSLEPIGGHNPFEVAQAGAAVITGPGYHNFAETFPPMIAAKGAVEVHDAGQLGSAVSDWLTQPDALQQAQQAAVEFSRQQSTVLDGLVEMLIEQLDLDATNG
ncbi:3-deoxy-D-manno-octulosonic acid transferase [Parasedimentitalea psychrophila]|uniref:3-deoxy-D-manno-octulosonic acid transferase n=1 Tax=Parasedimentitalea psychrophila TaxID=2997337 RepID=A0A9Y2P6X2_9RHOB|nr:3-deoxy-D-manno-octulosonic acid transferase [Parasedimentitalea psychrophila]WIY25458.1 3-deoxy-D-manno-octulosonic acid transferase [Parasedimentitalea psychrophila]